MEQHHTGIIALLDEACFLVGTVTDRVRERGREEGRRGEGVGEGEERVKKEEGGRRREWKEGERERGSDKMDAETLMWKQ